MKLSDKIRIIRKARGFSQEGLGDSLSRVSKYGISRQSVSDWENGKSEPKLDNIRDLASVLNVSFDALLDESINLDDKEQLAAILTNTGKEIKNTVNSEFRYGLYASTVSVKSFTTSILTGCLMILTAIAIGLSVYFDWNIICICVTSIVGGISLGFIIPAISELVDVAKGKVNTCVGELNNKYLIIYTREAAYNTLYIPIKQIIKIELGEKQKKKIGDVMIWVSGRSRAITIINIQNPQKLIDVFKKFLQEPADEDELVII